MCSPKWALPLDLHVLGLPLAFILSQDQTLRCISVFKINILSRSWLIYSKVLSYDRGFLCCSFFLAVLHYVYELSRSRRILSLFSVSCRNGSAKVILFLFHASFFEIFFSFFNSLLFFIDHPYRWPPFAYYSNFLWTFPLNGAAKVQTFFNLQSFFLKKFYFLY